MMDATNPWMTYFNGNAPDYLKEPFTQSTVKEVDFLVDLMGLAPGRHVLDMGCGVGRHAVELARRGCSVTGVDISEGMLAEAGRRAVEAGVTVRWVQADAARFASPPVYDAAVCLCEGAFGLLGPGDNPVTQPYKVLRSIQGALRPGAPFVLTCLNALRLVGAVAKGEVSDEFELATFTQTFVMDCETPGGKRKITLQDRSFVPTEVEALCRWAGFEVEHVWGGTAGNWGRRPVEPDEMEIMVVARKPASPEG